MLRITELKLPLDHVESMIKTAIIARLGIAEQDFIAYKVFRLGHDARKRNAIELVYTLDVEVKNEAEILARYQNDPHISVTPDTTYQFVTHAPVQLKQRPIVIGTGPCGLFAGLILAQMGFCPIILERGKEVRERTKDTFGLWRQSKFNPESNVQFGEGGAGTFSDGKLYTQIKDPHHYGRKVLTEFVKAGAPAEILYVSKPHIGTFKLVTMVEQIRATIESLGGEIRFQSRVDELIIDNGQVAGVILANGETIESNYVVLAVGHSARDTFKMLYERGVYIEAKPFSIGFRIEHPQSLIDVCRFGKQAGHPLLGAADYKLVHHCKNGRSVYSFCMCPGGTVVAATSEEGHVVTNGMSQYSRNERNANSALVVGITPDDYPEHPLAGIDLQRRLEAHAFVLGGSNYQAPAQRVGDFLTHQSSTKLGSVQPSYTPNVHLTDLSSALPDYAIEALREALPAFDKKIKGFAMDDAILTAVETRTSSPIRIKRNDGYQSINTRGLYPAGEGAGYAGGILSAAVDGIKVAEAVALAMVENVGADLSAQRE
ncbi:MAG: NAD(P)/FAD-dependent oxidoreductase [Methylococcaceae bacterium]|nr:NAD(P)/FAD-dependent oxidoreductase [Methylococcaceae bacterium]MDD1615811.1 NAD(P)/FAD-dependent oxidoreductase [Methylococcaceae bacterium]OYV19374.1 MAG: FAD dependent oxidoreductase [Methylococcaceae bacterium NSP1-2]